MAISLKNIFLKRIAVVDSGDNPEAEVVLFKAKEEKGGDNVMVKTFEEIVKDMPEEDKSIVMAEIEKAKVVEPEVKKEVETDEIVKSADPKIQELITKMKADSDNDRAEIKKMQDTLKKEKVEKTVSQFDKCGATEDLTELFTKADEATEALLIKVLKPINEQLGQSEVMKVKGSDGDKLDEKVEATVKKEAQEIMKSEGGTIEQATVKVYKRKPELYKQYLNEQNGGN